MQFTLCLLVLISTVAIGAAFTPLFMPIPLMCWLLFQTVLYYHRDRRNEE